MLSKISRTVVQTAFRTSIPYANHLGRFTFSQKQKENIGMKTQTLQQQKASQAIARSTGLNQFMTRTYNTTGLGLLGALSTSYAVMSIPALATMMGPLSIFGIIATLGGIIGASYMKPLPLMQIVNGVPVYKTANKPLRIGLYTLGIMGLGMTAAPLFAMAASISPSIMPTAIGLTTAIFGGASLAAYNMPKGKMLGYGGVLGGALLGLIGLQVVGLLTSLIMGPNPFSMMLFRADSYIGIGLFTIFIAYDTHVAIKSYEQGNADHLGMSIQFLLDFWNILVRIVSIMSRRD